jgi:hypothetical protein
MRCAKYHSVRDFLGITKVSRGIDEPARAPVRTDLKSWRHAEVNIIVTIRFRNPTAKRPERCQGWGRGFESLRPLQITPDVPMS